MKPETGKSQDLVQAGCTADSVESGPIACCFHLQGCGVRMLKLLG